MPKKLFVGGLSWGTTDAALRAAFEEFGARSFYEPDYPDDAFLVFGQETKGIPQAIIERHQGRLFKLPMRSGVIRSLNLANTVAAAAYQALRGKL